MKRLTTIMALFFLIGLIPVTNVFSGNPPSDYFIDESKLPFEALDDTDTIREWGVHKNAGYRIEVPLNWNGDLVVYCHGYRGLGEELTVSNPSAIRPYLIENGFAWAASSYSTNRYDVKAGVKDTHALVKRFNGLIGKPDRIYVTGHSMGGHITGVIIEQYPTLFDGALPMCGVMGACDLFDTFLDYHVVAQWLTDTEVGFPWPEEYTDTTVPAIKAGLEFAPGTFPFILNDAGQKLRTATKYRTGGDRPFFDYSFLYWGNFLFTVGLDGTVGIAPGNVMGNVDTVYQLDDDPALSEEEILLNEEVLRVAPDRNGRRPNGLANIPPISGDIQIPVLSLHTIGDLFVPFSMEQIYAQSVNARGGGDLLVQRAIRDVGHCVFSDSEQVTAFIDLVNWVENGVKPAGDDILDPDVVKQSDFGCTFTLEERPYALCP